jgi:crotonobetainyl-CoA:carnitine CoA-transferase CaiB-like acyl-CoA transferase
MRVVDLSDRVAGAFCVKMLAAAGHQATASSRPLSGWRSVGADPWLSAYLRHGVNTVDDPAVLREYLMEADVVIVVPDPEADREGDWPHGPDQLVVTVRDFPGESDYAGYRASPLIDWASGGHLHITGLPERAPLAGPRLLPEYITGYAAALAVELGLACRARGLDCSSVAVSTMELMASIHQNSFTMLAGTGTAKSRNRHPQPYYPMDIFECADGWACVAVVTEAQYDALVGVIGDPTIVIDERFRTPTSRAEHSNAFDVIVAPWFRARTVDDVVSELQAHDVPAVRLAYPSDVFDDPQLASRGFWTALPGAGQMPGVPFQTRVEPVPGRPPAQAELSATTGLPLAGLTVLDVTEFWSGPSCTRMLADFGAAVIRVERPGSRWHRMDFAQLADWKMNRGKLSLAVDLRTTEGAALVRRLAARADLVVENFRPGVMDRFGLGFSDLLPRTTPLVYLSLSGFGQNGPKARWASFGPLLEAASSIQARTCYPEGPPMLLGHSLPDPVGGLVGAFVALAALRQAQLDGNSRHLDVSQLEAYAACCGEELLRGSLGGSEAMVPAVSGVFATRGSDEWIAVEADGDEEIAALLSVVGIDEAPVHPERALAEALGRMDRIETARRLQSVGVAAFPVMSVADLAADAGLRSCGFLVDVSYGTHRAPMPGIPIRGVPHRADLSRRAPTCGEHSLAILRDYLRLPQEEIAMLLERGVVSNYLRQEVVAS